ncbi:MAG TPA: helix-turn-helix transcriptional regulator, partial [Pseudonocardiaceae bacterium]|nr:helix-turn-helix transcriptional regulator [Pseudonocardiaceae bacterium]
MARQPEHLAEQQRTLGRYLAALREAAGLHQADIARVVPCHRTTVAHAEAGSQLPDAIFWETADRVVGADGDLIASYDQFIQAKSAHLIQQQAMRRARAQATAQQLAADPSSRPDPASLMSHTRDDRQYDRAPSGSSEDMMRRELLRLLSMVAVLVTMPGADEQLDHSSDSSTTSSRFDNVTVDDCTALNEHLWRVFVLSKSKGAVLPLVRDQLEMLIIGLSRSREFSTHRRLCALTSELLQLAGEIFFDANRYSDAAYCYTLAAAASKEADAFDLWACAMTRHAFIEMHERRFDKASPMLELAARLARRGDGALSTLYWISSVQAQAFAGLGELAACQRALETAEQVRELPDDSSNGGWLRFDGSRLAEGRGSCYVQLRRPDLAENVLNDALRQNLSTRRRASVLVDLATIGIQRGDADQLITYAEPALEIATRTGSGFVSRKLQ